MSDTATLHCLGPVAAIPPGEGRVYRVGEKEVAVFRLRNGEVYASDARCPHRGGPLADGLVGDGRVICPLHGFTFDLATGCASSADCPPLATYRAFVDAPGDVLLETP